MRHLFNKLNPRAYCKIFVFPLLIALLFIKNSLGNEELLKVIFPQEEVSSIVNKGEDLERKITAIKSGENFTEIYKVFKDPINTNILHVLTETWTPDNLCHAGTASIGYAKLEKTESGYEIIVPHQIFNKEVGKWGRVINEHTQIDLIGPNTYGLTMTGEDMHQGIVSRYVHLYELPKDGIPKDLFSFLIEPCTLKNVKVSFDKGTSGKNGPYFDLFMTGKIRRTNKTLIWNWQEGTYKPTTKIEGYMASQVNEETSK